MSDLGSALWRWWGPVSLWTVGVLVAAILLDLALARRVRASFRILFYVAVPVRALLPLGMTSPIGLFGRGGAESAVGSVAGAHFQLLGPVAPADRPWMAAVALAWGAGIVLLLAAWIVARFRLSRRLRSARPARAAAHLSPRLPMLEHDALGPLVVGVLRPRIVLPSALLESAAAPDLSFVVAHELAHVARRDPLVTALLQWTAIALWPVAPVWVAVRRMRALVELACDEVALAGSDLAERRRYGETLLAMSGFREVSVGLHFGSDLAGRVRALSRRPRLSRLTQAALALGATVALLACAATRPASAPALVFAGQHVDVDLKDASLADVFKLLGDAGRVNVWIDDDLAAHPIHVSIQVRDAPWDQLFDRICRDHGLHWMRDGGSVRVSHTAPAPARTYVGRRVDLDFANVDVRAIMGLLADVSQLRIEVDDDVQAKVTLRVREVPWDQVLDSVLWSKGLRAERQGDVIRVRRGG